MKKVDVVIVGAGPAGIGAAVECKLAGKSVALLEKTDKICQTIHTFYKDGKRVDKAYKGQISENFGHIAFEDGTKESTLAVLADALKAHEIEPVLNCEVEGVKREGGKFIVSTAKESFECDNIIIAIGRMGKPNKPSYKIPSSLNKVVNYNANSVGSGENIIIVGGGNSAAEYAVDLAKSAKITLCYRQKAFTRLNEQNLNDVESAANSGKITLKLGTDIAEVADENGKAKLVFSDGSSEIYDRVIYAIGGSTPVDFLQKCGVNVDEQGIPEFDEHKQSNVKGIFVVGDIATKNGASIVVGLNDAVLVSGKLG